MAPLWVKGRHIPLNGNNRRRRRHNLNSKFKINATRLKFSGIHAVHSTHKVPGFWPMRTDEALVPSRRAEIRLTKNISLPLGDTVMVTTDGRTYLTRDMCSTCQYLLYRVGDDHKRRRKLATGGIAVRIARHVCVIVVKSQSIVISSVFAARCKVFRNAAISLV